MWNPCSNLKRHLERCHGEIWKRVKLADEQQSSLRSKKKNVLFTKQSTIKSHFKPLWVTIIMNKETFIRGIEQIIMSGIPFIFLKVKVFTLNGEIAWKLGVSLSRESIRTFTMDAANWMRDSLIKGLKGKLVYIKMDGAKLLKHWLVQLQQESIQVSKRATCSIQHCRNKQSNLICLIVYSFN